MEIHHHRPRRPPRQARPPARTTTSSMTPTNIRSRPLRQAGMTTVWCGTCRRDHILKTCDLCGCDLEHGRKLIRLCESCNVIDRERRNSVERQRESTERIISMTGTPDITTGDRTRQL